jgi:hypothetical protein
MTGVQLIGKDAVLTAFNKLGYDYWGLYEGKTPKVFGEGADTLTDWLELFCSSGSTATYTLRIYDTETLPTSQTGGADFVASLNFKLIDMYEGYGIAGHTNKLVQRIEGLEKKIGGADSEDDDGEDINSIIMGWLSNPEKLGMVVGAFKQLVGSGPVASAVSGNGATAQQSMSGFDSNNAGSSSDDEKLQRLAVALDQLEKKDPKLIEHLEKLGKLDPLIFNAVIAKLDAL